MNTHAAKTKKNKSQVVTNELSQKQPGNISPVHFIDNRPETKQAAQLKTVLNNYSTKSQQPIQKKENNTGLPDNLKTGIENLSGFTMDNVKVHYNSDKPAQLQAHAYAQGTDIHLASGQEKHLPHEAWHVVQQKQGRVKPTVQLKEGKNINNDQGLELEADKMGVRALSMKQTNDKVDIKQLVKHNNSNVIQTKISDLELRERIKRAYAGNQAVSQDILNMLLQDAFENTDTYEEAIARINNGIRHELAMFSTYGITAKTIKGPLSQSSKALKNRDPITIGDDCNRPEFVSSIPNTDVDKNMVIAEWRKLNTQKFYEKIRASLKIARDPKHIDYDKERDKLDALIQGYRQHEEVKSLIDQAVRVKAVKAKGASSGTGLDELFKTSETMKYLELSYRPPKDKSSVAKIDDEEFDWMDAQQQMRLSTEFIIWAGDLVKKISGHTGTFQRIYKGKWMTEKQSLMHEIRDDAISKRSNPATAIVEAIGTHLRITANVEEIAETGIYKSEEAKKSLLPNGRSVYDQLEFIKTQLEKHRDMLKHIYNYFQRKLKPKGDSSPLRARLGGEDYQALSPIRNQEMEMDLQKGRVKGNPLLNLSTQSRLEYEEEAIAIPPMPINPAIIAARNDIKKILNAKEASKINSAAKRMVKKLGEDPDMDEVDKIMIETYLEKLEVMNSDYKFDAVLDNLKEALKSLQ